MTRFHRRLTPHLRSPTERALSVQQLAWIGGHFSAWSHRVFILFSILSLLASVLTHKSGALSSWQQRLHRLDRALVDAAPSVGHYCWEAVIVLER